MDTDHHTSHRTADGLTAPAPLLVDVVTAAALLGIGRTKLYELVGRGELGCVHIGRCVRFPMAELERYVASLSDRRPAA